ncbi:MAG: ornithine cyclodeaminase family protein [Minwuiales bacterium]|nr:ornithine cyclodeaminase family protein [Minwuiales bacterium]
MNFVTAEQVHAALDYPTLTDRLDAGFRAGCEAPLRHHHAVATPGGGADATLLLMPAWQVGRHIGVKQVTIFPDNSARGLPSVMGVYFLLDANTGQPLSVIDGVSLTVRRTACASALAARYLARADSEHLLMVGTGAMAPHLIGAHAAARPIRRVSVWNRNPEKAARFAAGLGETGLEVGAADDLEAAAREADIISCATLSDKPLIHGDWIKPGAHLDLVGAFLPTMRESDDSAVRRASLFVDTRTGALSEGGDIVDPIKRGVISETDILADLYDLTRGDHAGRASDDEITLFKSVGHALEDLTAAELVAERV